MKMAILEFLPKIHYNNYTMARVQRRVKDLETNKEFWLTFGKSHKMFPRICNTKKESFIMLIGYNEDSKNRVKEITDIKTMLPYSHYLI